ncbi:aerolysin-like protein isoform X3 [Erpetoichthys calabaricus]|uniref:Aerolysin-like protein n=1 Tax=Erpetoichthys calabaricus TaxID=27687 RepID=A0A8C4SJG5_ERPCA|nr:aerolysin-like protein isoform X3 [Erpetoichthys calabaricus]XP_051784974.1 aerolysin-like protein isoform X3 [Erpetoichthys calabaricus]
MALPVVIIGGNGGGPFDFTGYKNGASLEKIGIWVGSTYIKAMKLWLTDGRSQQFGVSGQSPYTEFKFEDGEFFSSLSLWDNGDGTRLGAIKFRTTKSREFFAKMTARGLKTEYPVDVGSGVCLGVKGRSGSDVDSAGFMFINSIRSVEMKNVVYTTLYEVKPNVNVEEIKAMSYKNSSTIEQQYTMETSKKITKKSSWSVTTSLETSFSMTVQAGIPIVAEVKEEFAFKLGVSSTYAMETTEERTETMSYVIKVPPGKTMDINVTIGRANVDLPYEATVVVTCTNGSTYQYDKTGVYKGVTYTDAKAVIEESVKLLK